MARRPVALVLDPPTLQAAAAAAQLPPVAADLAAAVAAVPTLAAAATIFSTLLWSLSAAAAAAVVLLVAVHQHLPVVERAVDTTAHTLTLRLVLTATPVQVTAQRCCRGARWVRTASTAPQL